MTKRFCYKTRPVALKENIVCGNKYRITVLTENLIRFEYSENGVFEDRATKNVFFRNFPKVNFTTKTNNGILTIETNALTVTYKTENMFAPDTLSFKLKIEPASSYRYGEDFETLGGTTSTLDNINGEVSIGDGVVSRNGFSVLDDSDSVALNGETGWVELREENITDFYFFGHGLDYKAAVKDYFLLTGVPPLLPSYALGKWWSRYHQYTEDEYMEVMDDFKKREIPISVAVIDMDWHIVDIPEEQLTDKDDMDDKWGAGWTGYTWNEKFFPDYKRFLNKLKERNLKITLSLHPHSGVRSHEVQYEEMAKACGVDSKSGKRVPFNVLSMDFMEKYFDILHHPYENDGVDFWWMDWQQGKRYGWIHEPNKDGEYKEPLEKTDPQWLLNHLHIIDIMRNGKRPMFFSRYSGYGSQRYPVGFSGDTHITWDSLNFQPYFTATASNVGYPWWSHDIGGHLGGYYDDELTARWIQLGCFSPVLRLHSTAMPFIHREPWGMEEKYEKIAAEYLKLRHQLFPYIYTMNYRTNTELVPIITPMYYEYPKCNLSYLCKTQFMFGSELMVAPITQKSSDVTHLGSTEMFIPKGIWFDFFTGTPYRAEKPRMLKICRAVADYPVFAKAGAIVPMQVLKGADNHLGNAENLTVKVFSGADNTFTLYEDKGDGYEYQNGECAKTEMTVKFNESMTFNIAKPNGDISFLPSVRNWNICLTGLNENLDISLLVNGKPQKTKSVYNKETRSYMVLVTAKITDEITVTVNGNDLIPDNSDFLDTVYKILDKTNMFHKRKFIMMNNLKEYKEWPQGALNQIAPECPPDLFTAIKEQLSLNHPFA